MDSISASLFGLAKLLVAWRTGRGGGNQPQNTPPTPKITRAKIIEQLQQAKKYGGNSESIFQYSIRKFVHQNELEEEDESDS